MQNLLNDKLSKTLFSIGVIALFLELIFGNLKLLLVSLAFMGILIVSFIIREKNNYMKVFGIVLIIIISYVFYDICIHENIFN